MCNHIMESARIMLMEEPESDPNEDLLLEGLLMDLTGGDTCYARQVLPEAPIISSHQYSGFPERSYQVLCPFCNGIHTHMGFTKGGQNDRMADCGGVDDVYDVVDRHLNEEEKDRLHSRN